MGIRIPNSDLGHFVPRIIHHWRGGVNAEASRNGSRQAWVNEHDTSFRILHSVFFILSPLCQPVATAVRPATRTGNEE